MAPSIRILARFPEIRIIGIEIPNLKREHVFLKEVARQRFISGIIFSPADCFGVIFGHACSCRFNKKCPTCSLPAPLFRQKVCSQRHDLQYSFQSPAGWCFKFLMIDPKRLELSSYEGIPHLMHPVVVIRKKLHRFCAGQWKKWKDATVFSTTWNQRAWRLQWTAFKRPESKTVFGSAKRILSPIWKLKPSLI